MEILGPAFFIIVGPGLYVIEKKNFRMGSHRYFSRGVNGDTFKAHGGTKVLKFTDKGCFAKAFGTYLIENDHGVKIKTVVVGTDPRASSEFIKGIIFSLLTFFLSYLPFGLFPLEAVKSYLLTLSGSSTLVTDAAWNVWYFIYPGRVEDSVLLGPLSVRVLSIILLSILKSGMPYLKIPPALSYFSNTA